MAERLAVGIAHHVIQVDDASELSQADASRLDIDVDPPFGPVAMRAHHHRPPPPRNGRPVEVARQEEAGEGFQDHSVDRISLALERADNPRVEVRSSAASARARE